MSGTEMKAIESIGGDVFSGGDDAQPAAKRQGCAAGLDFAAQIARIRAHFSARHHRGAGVRKP